MYSLNHATEDSFDFNHSSEIIPLEQEHFDKAIENSQIHPNQCKQWYIYLQNIALFAIREWLERREPTISISQSELLDWQCKYSHVIDAAFNVFVGDFKVCIIPTITFSHEELTVDEEVTVPRAVIDLPEFNAHYYMVISIEEELEIATIEGFLRYDQLLKYKPKLQPEIDWNYHLPVSWFNGTPNELLLYLQCLSPTAIPLPEILTHRQNLLAKVQPELLNLLPQLNNRALWEVLTWEQGVAILTTPALLNWLYQSPQKDTPANPEHLSDVLQSLTQQAINVRSWLHNQVDSVMQELSWQILSPPSPLLRTEQTPEQELENILTDIERRYKISISKSGGRAYRDILLENALRVYAVTWSLPHTNQGWNLLLVLKAIRPNYTTFGFTLQVSDQTGILVEEELAPARCEEYIFTLVEGSNEDKFKATITSTNGRVQTLPIFEFS